MKASRAHIRGVIFAVLGGIGWGFSGSCAQYLFANFDTSPFWISSIRMSCAGVALSLICLIGFHKPFVALWKSPKNVLHLVIFALVGLAFCQTTYLLAIQYSNVATATMIQYSTPIIIIAYMCIRTPRKPFRYEIIAAIGIVVGVFLLATHGNPNTLVLAPLALFWALVSAFAYALYSLLPASLMARYGSLPVVASGLLIAGAVFVVVVQPWQVDVSFTSFGWFILFVGLVLCGTIISFSLYFQAVKDIGAARTSLLASVETVAATVFAVVWLGTSFVWIDFIGFALILATVLMVANHAE